ncbi:MAG: hypothetical protein H6708_33530 [Kofleriaceae bacterium]|nr:hypothetical protein [Myxococcales bacterium]MCB9565334.1 hypothetical protein [Kofleriaceae bacterium]
MEPSIVVPGVHRLEQVLAWGWSMSMHLLALPDGGVLVHSPTWCGDGTFEAVEAIGEVRAILAPNHFHHLSLARFRQRWPDAIAVAAPAALPRLARKGHADLRDLDALTPLLPAGARAIPCAMKSGEAWLSWPTPDGAALVVCDAFFHVTRPVRGFRGWVLRRLQIAPGLCFGATTRRLAIADRAAFLAWATSAIADVAPTWLIPSHGAALHDPDLAGRLQALLAARLA